MMGAAPGAVPGAAAGKNLLPKALLGGEMAAVVKVEVVEGSNLIVADKGGESPLLLAPSAAEGEAPALSKLRGGRALAPCVSAGVCAPTVSYSFTVMFLPWCVCLFRNL